MDKSKLLAKWLQQKSVDSERLAKKPEDSPKRLSFGQRRLFFLQRTNPSSPFYNYPELYTLRGNWDIETFKAAIYEVCQYHDIFLHNFSLDSDHEPEIIINHEREPVLIEHVQLSDLPNEESSEDFLQKKGRYVFDLAEDVLFRVTIITISDNEHKILFNLHHIITDKWSMKIFREQLLDVYGSKTGIFEKEVSQEVKYDYLDFSYHQSNTAIPEEEINYWKEKLSSSVEEMPLPVDHEPSEVTHNGKFNTRALPQELSKKIKQFAKQQETTLFTFFVGAYSILLHRYSGENTIHIGTPISNRSRKEWESLIGFFNETVLLQTHIEANSSIEKYMGQVKSDVLEAFDHKKVPFETIVSHLSRQREVQKNPLFRTMFLYHKKEEEQSLPGLQMDHETFDIGVAKFDLTIYVEEEKEGLNVTFEYATDYFEDETINRMHTHFQILLEDIVTDSNQNINELEILTAEEIAQFDEWNETDINTEPTPIDKAFEDIALANPNSVAVTDSNGSLMYQELNERANKLANKILEHSLSNKRLGLFLGRNSDMIVAMLGTLKSGCSYVPLDPSYPKDRINYIIKDAKIDMVVTSSDLLEELDVDIKKILIEDIATASDQRPSKTHTTDDEVYVIYTSGSTGKPKGVSISHKNLYYSTFARPLFYEENNPTCFLLFSSFSFDSSVAGIYWTLLTGGHLLISKEKAEQDIQKVASLIDKERVSHTLLLPSLYRVLLLETNPNLLKSLEIVMVAGEECSTRTVEQHFNTLPTAKLYNEYGPTEGTVWCIAHKVSPKDSVNRVPIGRPIPGAKTYILDSRNRRVPVGVKGELTIGGKGISNGYIGNAEADNNRLIENFMDEGKLYKTGDVASYRKDGSIDFWGRIDNQIKIRGHRVELKEIERVLISVKQVHQANVIFDDSKQQLFAFVIQENQSFLQEKEIKQRLKESLPAYMIPSSILMIDDFPRLPNGKIDKKRLKEMIQDSNKADKDTANEELTSIERDLIEIWKEILNEQNIGVNDNFFAMGGDSISSIRMVSKAKAIGIDLSPTQIFEAQTIKEIASHLNENETQIELPEATSEAPQTPIQHWFFDFFTTHPDHWHQILEFETRINKTEAEWKQLFDSIVQRHRVLRSYFNNSDQIFTEKRSDSLTDESFHFFQKGDKHELTQKLIKETDISAKNLFQVLVLSDKQKTTVRLIAHHLIIDIFSFNQLIQEISIELSNKIVPQPSYQYSQFSNYLEQLNQDGFFAEELSFWESQYCQNEFWEPFYESDIRENDLQLEIIALSEEKTNNLVKQSQQSTYKMEEVVLASLLLAINQNIDIPEILVGLEHTGRELPKQISFSDSVGWFTSFYPRKFAIQKGETDIHQLIQNLRETPNFGVGFGVLKYLDKQKSLQSVNRFPITYNYLGKLETQQFKHIDFYQYIFEGARNKRNKVFSPFDFSASVMKDQLQIHFRYPHELFSSTKAKDLLRAIEQQLSAVSEQLMAYKSDGEDAKNELSDSDLNELSKMFEL
jgi:amino acid adenylation domain-containing protein/non-ribosomal peptide synthase protein (TIGR01720 family)